MTEFNFEIKNINDAIDYVIETLDGDIKKALLIVQAIQNDPSNIAGPRASIEAVKLAGLRTRMTIAAQYWKLKCLKSKSIEDRLMKDSLIAITKSLEEDINTLKLRARIEDEIIDRNK